MALWKRRTWKVLTVFLLVLMTFLTGCGGNAGKDAAGDTATVKSGCENCTCWKKAGESEEADTGQNDFEESDSSSWTDSDDQITVDMDEDGCYTSKEDVSDYLIQYGRLPKNFITKKEAKKLGWHGGGLDRYAPGKCIGGDYFGNYEKNLPVVKGRTYHECDIDTLGADSRGPKRLVYSDDGNIYYTEDHYKTFELIYGDDQ